jgi:hypothetical protein
LPSLAFAEGAVAGIRLNSISCPDWFRFLSRRKRNDRSPSVSTLGMQPKSSHESRRDGADGEINIENTIHAIALEQGVLTPSK